MAQILCMVFFTSAVFGQSLSIAKTGQTNLVIGVTAEPNNPSVLQTSANLHLWVDIDNAVSGKITNQLDRNAGSQRFFRLAPATPPAPDIRIVLLGDSTVADFVTDFSEFSGWGQGMYGYFKANARIVNLAIPSYSSKRFLASSEKQTMLAIKPDYVLIQFGLIDQFGSAADQTTTLPEFADNLRTIVQLVRGFNGTPILVTPSAAQIFNAEGKAFPTYPDRFAVIKNVAAETQTYLIDLNRLSVDLLNQLGEIGSEYIFAPGEFLHFTDEGAMVMAGLVVNALPDSLGPYLKGIFDHLPKY